MKRHWLTAGLLALQLHAPLSAKEPAWRDYEKAVFAQAHQEKKLVLLNLEAVWCHWCHVMQETTYQDPAVQKILEERYLVTRVDSDARPDIANRYEDYGWPATVIYDSEGRELVKLSGYIEPEKMRNLLSRLAKNPKPELDEEAKPDLSKPGAFTPTLVNEMQKQHFQHYDYKLGGWGFIHKFLNWTSMEYALLRSRQGDPKSTKMARQTLNGELALLDPAWGGVYQYSDSNVWNHPHFEKVLDHQTGNLRMYSLAYSQFGDPRYLHAASRIASYLQTFLLSPEGAFYTSQDADIKQGEHSAGYFALGDAARRKLGIPRIDTHIYARENGWVIEALATYYAASGDPKALAAALRAAEWVLKNRSLEGGGFSHGEEKTGPFLGDTLGCGRAFLALYNVTADPIWLARAQAAEKFIEAHFLGTGVGVLTATDENRVLIKEENVAALRFANLLSYALGEDRAQNALSQTAQRYLSLRPIATEVNTGAALLAQWENSHEPVAVTVVGSRNDPTCRELFEAANRAPSHYKLVVWWDPATQPPPPHAYPATPTNVAYVCAAGQCVQVHGAKELAERCKKLKLP